MIDRMEQVMIYLWTRDARMPVSQQTEEYVVDHIEKAKSLVVGFSDDERAAMAARIVERIRG